MNDMRKLMEAVEQLDERKSGEDIRTAVQDRLPGHGLDTNYDENAVVDAIEQARDAIFAVGKAAGHIAAKQIIAAGVEDGDDHDTDDRMFDEIVKRFTSEVTSVAAGKTDTDLGKHSKRKGGRDLDYKSKSGNLMRQDQELG